MRRLGTVLLPALAAALGAALAGCGSGGGSAGGTGVEDAVGPSAPAYEQVRLVSVTEGGGETTDRITWVDDDGSLRRYVASFPSVQLRHELLAAARHADLAVGQRLGAAVVDVGCTPPTRVTVTGAGDDLRIEASGKPSHEIQCLAPVTTVALVGVED